MCAAAKKTRRMSCKAAWVASNMIYRDANESRDYSIQVKSVLKETSEEASDASVVSNCFCLHGTGQD